MTSEQIYTLSGEVFKMIAEEAQNTKEMPKLITNFAFTKYNKSFNLEPVSIEASLLTSSINNLIVSHFYKEVVKYAEPDINFDGNGNFSYGESQQRGR